MLEKCLRENIIYIANTIFIIQKNIHLLTQIFYSFHTNINTTYVPLKLIIIISYGIFYLLFII